MRTRARRSNGQQIAPVPVTGGDADALIAFTIEEQARASSGVRWGR
jgi:hypothetical protein